MALRATYNKAYYFFCLLLCLSCSNKTLDQIGKDFKTTPVRNSSLDFAGIESVSGVTTSKATLHWSDVLESYGYVIYQSKLGEQEAVVTTLNPPIAEYTVSSLEPNTTYKFRVAGLDNKGIVDPNDASQTVTTQTIGSFSVIDDLSTSVGATVSGALDCTDTYGSTPTYAVSSQSDSHANCSISSGRVSCTPTAMSGVSSWSATVTISCTLNDYDFEESFVLSVR